MDRSFLLGVFGHVDHGKTALVRALTGVDTDRLPEEKRRGMTIDLGFAPLKLAPGVEAEVVDAPGHEKLLKNMLAGAATVDGFLLVVSAGEGISGQTVEHAAALQHLGVTAGIVAVSQIDRVDGQQLCAVRDQVYGWLAGTSLAGCEICAVSAFTGVGLPELRQALGRLAARIPDRPQDGPFALWIDRVFSLPGHGTVVTGTVLSGELRVQDKVTNRSSGREYRVRNLQRHAVDVERVMAGQRAAINLAGAELTEIKRGQLLVRSGAGAGGRRWAVLARWTVSPPPLRGRRLRINSGTAEYPVCGRRFEITGDGTGIIEVAGAGEIIAIPGTGLVGRDGNNGQLLFGGIWLLPVERSIAWKRIRPLAEAWQCGRAGGIMDKVLAAAGCLPVEQLPGLCGIWPAGQYLAGWEDLRRQAVQAGRLIADRQWWLGQQAKIAEVLQAVHAAEPQRGGLTAAEIAGRLRQEPGRTGWLLATAVQAGRLDEAGGGYTLPGKGRPAEQAAFEQKLSIMLEQAGLGTISPGWLAAGQPQLTPREVTAVWRRLVQTGQIAGHAGYYWSAGQLAAIRRLLHGHFATRSDLTLAEFRDMCRVSRKLALAMLELCDRRHWTVRQGDRRLAGHRLERPD
ncbi:MAG: selenocysteine-specific translation elongation factor [Negativicutes bacterium]|nr:selenocysteine-specific translation elongation factor [Negativicutes bacterium]